ncbi:MAG TPA: tRNA dimethylallyltransferase, partial [Anaeromyxobacteraceae bacterium]|nr:tRNA dimethylallyltransferase [Anaeromyxobacteraceae bacterium]
RDPALRARLEEEAARLGRPALHARLAAVDPAAAARIGPNDLVRIVRALEMAEGGRTQSEVFAAHGHREARYPARLLALDPPRPELHARIERRAPALFEGLLAEAERLRARLGEPLPPKLPLGYAEAAAVLRGELDRVEALRRLVVAHRRYARRQVVWLRREPGVEWLRPPLDAAALAADLRRWLEA